jgi:hypothetical protein
MVMAMARPEDLAKRQSFRGNKLDYGGAILFEPQLALHCLNVLWGHFAKVGVLAFGKSP